MKKILAVKDLAVMVEGKTILSGVDLKVAAGETLLLAGPNGSGKSTLAMSLLGNPKYAISRGKIIFGGKDITASSPSERARLGLFLSFQNPVPVPGVPLVKLIKIALEETTGKKIDNRELFAALSAQCARLGIPEELAERGVNEDLSGGERKRSEMLQLAMLKPKLAVIDEIDSGLDKSGMALIAAELRKIKKDNPGMALVAITHYGNFGRLLAPDRVAVMEKGKIANIGGKQLLRKNLG